MRMTVTTLLLAGLVALVGFWILLRVQRNDNEAAAALTPSPDANALLLTPTVMAERRTEVVLVDGQNVALDILNSKDVLTEQDWAQFGLPIPSGQTVLPTATTVPPPNVVAEGQPVVATAVPTIAVPLEATVPLVIPTNTPMPAAAVPANVPQIVFKLYTVVAGDSLYSIALAQNSSIELMALHSIDAGNLQPGTQLNLPYANPAYCPGYRAYVIRDHDTVFSIARTYNTTVDTIAQLNHLDANYVIKVAEVLCLP